MQLIQMLMDARVLMLTHSLIMAAPGFPVPAKALPSPVAATGLIIVQAARCLPAPGVLTAHVALH